MRPGLDDKRLASWNALMLAALAEAGAVLSATTTGRRRSGAPIPSWRLRDERGRLRRTWKDGRARLDGYLEDHAYCGRGAPRPLRATFDARWFAEARAFGTP